MFIRLSWPSLNNISIVSYEPRKKQPFGFTIDFDIVKNAFTISARDFANIDNAFINILTRGFTIDLSTIKMTLPTLWELDSPST